LAICFWAFLKPIPFLAFIASPSFLERLLATSHRS
jgi:hypothetical protein